MNIATYINEYTSRTLGIVKLTVSQNLYKVIPGCQNHFWDTAEEQMNTGFDLFGSLIHLNGELLLCSCLSFKCIRDNPQPRFHLYYTVRRGMNLSFSSPMKSRNYAVCGHHWTNAGTFMPPPFWHCPSWHLGYQIGEKLIWWIRLDGHTQRVTVTSSASKWRVSDEWRSSEISVI